MGQPGKPIRVLAFMEAYVVNGAAKSLLNFCDSLKAVSDKRVEIAIATFFRGKVKIEDTPNEFVAAVRARGIPAFVIAESAAFDISTILAMRRVVHQYAPDVIETNNVKSHFLVRLAGLHRGRRWVAVHHGYTSTDSKILLMNKLDRVSLPAADRVVLVCGAFREQLAANRVRVKKVSIIHNSAAVVHKLPETQTLRDRYGLRDSTKILVTIGRLSFEKGHADLLYALEIVKHTHPNAEWRLFVVGSGPELERLQEQVQEQGITDKIIFTGHQTDVLPFLALADAMILPSHTEGSPHVVLEAMAAGVPIIATRVGGVPEILNDDTARLVPAGNADALADAIGQLLPDSNPARTRAAAAKRLLEERFSHDAYRENMVHLLQSVHLGES